MDEILIDVVIMAGSLVFVLGFWVIVLRAITQAAGGTQNLINTILDMAKTSVSEGTGTESTPSIKGSNIIPKNTYKNLFEKSSVFNRGSNDKDNNPFEV